MFLLNFVWHEFYYLLLLLFYKVKLDCAATVVIKTVTVCALKRDNKQDLNLFLYCY